VGQPLPRESLGTLRIYLFEADDCTLLDRGYIKGLDTPFVMRTQDQSCGQTKPPSDASTGLIVRGDYSSRAGIMAVLNEFSRYVVAWEHDQTLERAFVLSAMDLVPLRGQPATCNRDQESHFTRLLYLERLRASDLQFSIDSKGRVLDNIFMHHLRRMVKSIRTTQPDKRLQNAGKFYVTTQNYLIGSERIQ